MLVIVKDKKKKQKIAVGWLLYPGSVVDSLDLALASLNIYYSKYFIVCCTDCKLC